MKRNDYEMILPDQLFPTDNDLEIPTLDINMQAKECQTPFLCFGEQRRTFNLNGAGSLHFYTDDYRFSAIYEHPEKIFQHHPAVIVEPNFSLYNEYLSAYRQYTRSVGLPVVCKEKVSVYS